MSHKLTVCICTYNRYELLEKCINSLTKQSVSDDGFKILVADNSPDAAVAEKEKQKYLNVSNLEYMHIPTPGLSNARNVGAEICGTEYIAYIDDDAIASKDWVKSLIQGFEAFNNAEMVGGPIQPIWGKDKPSWIPKWREGFLTIIDWGEGDAREVTEHEWFAGANMAFKTDAILKYGGFPTNLGRIGGGATLLSNEEIDLVDSIKENNGQIIYAPSAKVDHLVDERRLTREWFKKRVSWQVVSDLLMTGKPRPSDECWSKIEQYYEQLEPQQRNLKAFNIKHDDPNLFHVQLEALESFLHLSFIGYGVK